MCCYVSVDSLLGWMPSNPYFQSILHYPFGTASSIHNSAMHNLTVLTYILKLLRVSDLERLYLRKKFATEIVLLVHLRYLAMGGPMRNIPSSIGSLWRLETFLFNGTKGKVKLPEALLRMAYLKHVYVNERAAFQILSDTFPPKESFNSSIQILIRLAFHQGYIWHHRKGNQQFKRSCKVEVHISRILGFP